MTHEEIFSKVDHTLLEQTATWEEIRRLCDEAVKYHTASVCIPPCYVKKAKEYVENKMKICTVIGFPNGNHTMEAKVFEAQDAIKNGADEVDMVINIGALKEKDYEYVKNEIKEVKKAVGDHILKVIIETCLLDKEEKIIMCRLITEAGADYIKTSTGFSKAGAVLEDIELFGQYTGRDVHIKAAGGISSFADAEKFIGSGAERLGTSRLVKLEEKESKNI